MKPLRIKIPFVHTFCGWKSNHAISANVIMEKTDGSSVPILNSVLVKRKFRINKIAK
jgi:hypothetical protein